jgi:hypothetical protein
MVERRVTVEDPLAMERPLVIPVVVTPPHRAVKSRAGGSEAGARPIASRSSVSRLKHSKLSGYNDERHWTV